MKKLAVLSDIHSNNLLLKEIVSKLKKEDVTDYIFCGDYVTDGFENNETLDFIKTISNNVVLGNRELNVINYDGKSWEKSVQWQPTLYAIKDLREDNLDYIRRLPLTKIIEVEGKKICFSHISPLAKKVDIHADANEVFDEIIEKVNADIFIFGHTHEHFIKEYKGKIFINPGSISYSKDNSFSTCGILEISDKIVYRHRKYKRNIVEIKDYYVNSEYYKVCPEWSNILIHSYKDGKDYCTSFYKYISKATEGNIDDIWNYKFKEYMKLKNLEVY